MIEHYALGAFLSRWYPNDPFAGAQEALGIGMRALVEPGDHAIMVLPAYQPSEYALSSLCETNGIVLDAAHGWALDLGQVAAAIRPVTRVMLVNFPNNPTGKLLTAPDFQALIALCRKHCIWLVKNEVYRSIDRNPALRLPCVADADERGVSVDALSKGYGLPRLRVGWIACQDQGLLARTRALKHIASLCLAGPSEALAHIALGTRETVLGRNRAIAADNLKRLRGLIADNATLLDRYEPDGGVVGYVRYRGTEVVEAFATRMAAEAEALVLPASVWRSALAPTPSDRFRIGFGRRAAARGIADIGQSLHRDRTRSAA